MPVFDVVKNPAIKQKATSHNTWSLLSRRQCKRGEDKLRDDTAPVTGTGIAVWLLPGHARGVGSVCTCQLTACAFFTTGTWGKDGDTEPECATGAHGTQLGGGWAVRIRVGKAGWGCCGERWVQGGCFLLFDQLSTCQGTGLFSQLTTRWGPDVFSFLARSDSSLIIEWK